MVVAAIKNKFNNGEVSIYQSGDVFNIPNKSIVGTKSFYITNLGRVFAHDTGGIFGEEQSKSYTGNIDLSFNDYGITLSNEVGGEFSFNVLLTDQEFINVYEKLSHNNLVCKNNMNANSICKYRVGKAINGEHITFTDYIKIENNKLKFSKDNYINEIPFYRIKSVKDKDKFIEISGSFSVRNSTIYELRVYTFDEKVKKEILNKMQNYNQNIFNIVGDVSEIFTTSVTANIHDKFIADKSIAICFDSNNIYFIDEFEKKCLVTLKLSKTNAYYSNIENKIVFESENNLYQINIYNGSSLKEYLIRNIIKTNKKLICRFGRLSGVLNGESFKGEEVGILSDGSKIIFISRSNLKVLNTIDMEKLEVQIDNNNVFIIFKNQIALLKVFVQSHIHEFFTKQSDSSYIFGYTSKDEPFFIKQDEDKILLSQSPSTIHFKYYNEEITDISITKYGDKESIFSELQISTIDNKKNLIINVPNTIIKDLIYKTYYYSKNKSLEQVPAEQLYLSYSRQVNDYILFHYFGQIFAMYHGFKEIQKNEKNIDLKNEKIINYLYYSIQALKKHFDTVSIYLPSTLANEDANILRDQSAQIPYKNLQRNLMSLTSQINRSLNEIENSIASVSFVLISREDYTKVIEQRTKDGYSLAVGMGVLGVMATTLTGGLAAPFFLSGILTGINTRFSDSYAKEQEKIRENNEKNRISFSVDKMTDSLEHLTQTLLPYYINETNNSVYQTFQQLYQIYKPQLESKEVQKELFNKITQYYTYKQLPVDNSVTIKKRDLIELTHQTVNLSNQYLDSFQKEVTGNVPKSLETTATIK
ncbi:hypothetical protein [Bacillus sp. B1-b2]|uniref:hypothetical protein n=1 Tax=Bacillus sp. B1-b2 TaxID=2653201 RepID=UPI001261743E|nr:hypothetical protein [Bacillus sp. B1-b2]KAB7665550.1 hypothetical protein F9279_20195 [Bacillus sp. B1-b2]